MKNIICFVVGWELCVCVIEVSFLEIVFIIGNLFIVL